MVHRFDLNTTKWLDLPLESCRLSEVAIKLQFGWCVAQSLPPLTPSAAGSPNPSPMHALLPQQALSCPFASHCARRPPAPSAVLMRARFCASQARIRRPL